VRDPFRVVSDVNILGAFFPAWMLSIALGIVCTLAVRALWVRTGISPYVGPPALIYPCLVVLCTLGVRFLLFSG